jgi:dienelactone hydrolase
MEKLIIIITLLFLSSGVQATVQGKEVTYSNDGEILKGYIAYDDNIKGKRPGVLVVHEWWGHNEHARNQAKRLAEAGYVGFALDMYGKGKVATHPKDAEAFMTEATKDPAVVTARFNAALEQLKKNPHVDPKKIAAIGYCFGGAVILGQARAGADLAAVASFHGLLATQNPAEPVRRS